MHETVSFWRVRIWSLYFQPLEYALDKVSELKQSFYYFKAKSGESVLFCDFNEIALDYEFACSFKF